jgi:hypothetical protein
MPGRRGYLDSLSTKTHIIIVMQWSRDMTGDQSRGLRVGARVCWGEDKNDQGTVTEKNWSGVTLKWDNRDNQSVSHNDMKMVFLVPEK